MGRGSSGISGGNGSKVEVEIKSIRHYLDKNYNFFDNDVKNGNLDTLSDLVYKVWSDNNFVRRGEVWDFVNKASNTIKNARKLFEDAINNGQEPPDFYLF